MTASSAFDVRRRQALRRNLLRWYDHEHRPLPWRERPTLYGTWIAEIMLQQTTVQSARHYWERFLVRFDTVTELAAASEAEVLAMWSGLGYYQRARRLHAAARRIVTEHHGRLPCSRDEWLALPGVGRYTAGAIASIALGQPVPAVDANARRVILRWCCSSSAEAAAMSGNRLEAEAGRLVATGRPGDWNQAVMELGALVCTPAVPGCDRCPVSRWCRAAGAGRPESIPPPARPQRATRVVLSMLVLRRGDRVLIVPPGSPTLAALARHARPLRKNLGDLLPGLWGLPSTPWYAPPAVRFGRKNGHLQTERSALAAWRAWLGRRGMLSRTETSLLGTTSHTITSYRMQIWVVGASLTGTGFRKPAGARWYAFHSQNPWPLSALVRKALDRAGSMLAGAGGTVAAASN